MPVFQWRNFGLVFKKFIERLRIFESELVGYFSNTEITRTEYVFGLINQFVMDMLLGILSCEGTEHITQITRRNFEMTGKLLNSRRTVEQ